MPRQETDEMSASFIIHDDLTQVTPESLVEIVARPKRPFTPGQIFQLKEWFQLFLLQPWAHEEAISDLQLEEVAVLQVK